MYWINICIIALSRTQTEYRNNYLPIILSLLNSTEHEIKTAVSFWTSTLKESFTLNAPKHDIYLVHINFKHFSRKMFYTQLSWA